MVVYNHCRECGSKMSVREPRNDPFLKKMLEESKISICNICEPKSSWRKI